jgi:hypothetical protein
MKKFLFVLFVLAIAGCSTTPVNRVISKKIVREVPAKSVSK